MRSGAVMNRVQPGYAAVPSIVFTTPPRATASSACGMKTLQAGTPEGVLARTAQASRCSSKKEAIEFPARIS